MRFQTLSLNHLRRPVIPVVVESKSGQRLVVDALVDTGSDITLFPERIAERLGIDLEWREVHPLSSALGVIGEYRTATVRLQLLQESETMQWEASVGFLPREMVYSILGTTGFFDTFQLSYNAVDGWIERVPLSPAAE